jgi:biotin carboxyl carrier protein
VGDAQATVEVTARTGTRVRARIEDASGVREVSLSLIDARPSGERDVRLGDAPIGAWVGPELPAGSGERQVEIGRGVATVRAVREIDAWLSGGDDAAGSGAVSVAMPGRVVKVLARAGDAVEKGQPVMIIEAMKMENEAKAKRAGVVQVVHVKEGDSVEGGKILLEIGD